MIPFGQINDPQKRANWEAYLQDCFDDRRFFIEEHLKIRTMDKRIAPLKLNEAQRQLFELVDQQERAGKPVRIIGVKPRKVGLSTGIQSIFFHVAATHPLTKGLTVAHDLDSTEEMFQMAGLFYDELPDPLRPMKRYSNRKELVFENPDERTRKEHPGLRSQLRIATAGDPELGRSKDIHLLHCSEMGYWPKRAGPYQLAQGLVGRRRSPVDHAGLRRRHGFESKAGRNQWRTSIGEAEPQIVLI